MSNPIQVNWNGEKALTDMLKHGDEKIRDFVENAVDIAKTDHEYKDRSGTNSASITWEKEEGAYRIYTTSGYGGWLELGTSKMPAFPAILPAVDKSKREVFGG